MFFNKQNKNGINMGDGNKFEHFAGNTPETKTVSASAVVVTAQNETNHIRQTD